MTCSCDFNFLKSTVTKHLYIGAKYWKFKHIGWTSRAIKLQYRVAYSVQGVKMARILQNSINQTELINTIFAVTFH